MFFDFEGLQFSRFKQFQTFTYIRNLLKYAWLYHLTPLLLELCFASLALMQSFDCDTLYHSLSSVVNGLGYQISWEVWSAKTLLEKLFKFFKYSR